MSPMASQITGVSIVCSIIGSGEDQRKHQSSASLGFVRQYEVLIKSHFGGGIPDYLSSKEASVIIVKSFKSMYLHI